MTDTARYAIGTILTWLGYGFGLRALYLALKLLARDPSLDRAAAARGATISVIASGVGLFGGSENAVMRGLQIPAGLHIPLAWFVMPFPAWAAVVSVILVGLRLIQAFGALNQEERNVRLKAGLTWALAAILFGYIYRLDPDAQVLIVKGAIPISPQTALAMILLAAAAVAAMVFTARAARARGIAKGIVIHLALLTGSVLFGVPFAWLVITSFKEDIDMSSPNGIVWVPRVAETVPYYNKAEPLFETKYQGSDVQGHVIERRPDGSIKLDINKPMSMRGMTVDALASQLKEIPTEAALVTAKMDGQAITGKVIEELEDGHKRVEAVSPPAFAGRQQVFAPSDVVPIRKVGLRTQNYPDALDFLPQEAHKGLTYLQNTLIIVVLVMVGTILSSSIVAYAFSRMRFPGRDVLFTVMLATMMLPGAVTKLPQFMIFKQLGWIDTLYPLWVPAFFGSAFNIFMLRQFFKQVPMELEDAAKIDGAGYLRTFWGVMMPQIKPALAVIALLTFVGTWNNFLDPLIYINSPEHMTISYAVQLYSSDRADEPGLLTAFTTMSMAPVLALFFFAQRYFIEGVTLTGLGGR
ncbi:MAG: carbohydrate ABC transporter permease [Fimbriimonadales bacterium]